MSPTCWLSAGPVPAGGGVRQPAVAAGPEPVRGARRRPPRRGLRHRRDPAGRARPGQRPPDRPGPALPGIRLRRVRGRPDHRHHRGRAGRADDRDRAWRSPAPGGNGAGPRAEPQHRLAARSGLPAGAAGGPADRPVGFGRARDRLPAGQPRGPGSRGRAAAVHRLGARRSHLAGRPPARPGEGLLHQPRHRHHRRELRRVERVRPGLPRAAARPVGRRGRGRRDDGRAGPGRVGRGGRQAARHPRRFGGRLDRAGRGDVGHRGARRAERVAGRRCLRRGGVLLRRGRPAGVRGAHARLRVALPGRADRAAAGVRRAVRRAGSGRARERRHLPGAAAAGARRSGRAARAVRVDRGGPGRARHPVRVHHLRGRVARVPQGGEHRGQPGGRALLLRPDHGVHPAGRPARAAGRRRGWRRRSSGRIPWPGTRGPR